MPERKNKDPRKHNHLQSHLIDENTHSKEKNNEKKIERSTEDGGGRKQQRRQKEHLRSNATNENKNVKS